MSVPSGGWIDFQVKLPYPKIDVKCPNRQYAAQMLDNMGGQNSEMGAVCMYVYNNFVTHQVEEVAQVFQSIGMVEMHHLHIFGELALRLGEDPRLWSDCRCKKTWWSPASYHYTMDLPTLLKNALQTELEAIDKYRCQAGKIEDESIVELLKRIILDEESHASVLKVLLQKYGR